MTPVDGATATDYIEDVLADLDEKAYYKQLETDAKQRCGRIDDTRGDGGALGEFFNAELAHVEVRPRPGYTEIEFPLMILYALSDNWRDNLDPSVMHYQSVTYAFPHGCRVRRYRGWLRKMLLIDVDSPERTLTLVWRHDHWVVESQRGWKSPKSTRQHSLSRGLPRTTR